MSAPFGHATVPPSMKKCLKYPGFFSGSKIGPVSQSEKSIVLSTPSLNAMQIVKSPQYSARMTMGKNSMMASSVQWGNSREWLTHPGSTPVGFQLYAMRNGPLLDEMQGCPGPER